MTRFRPHLALATSSLLIASLVGEGRPAYAQDPYSLTVADGNTFAPLAGATNQTLTAYVSGVAALDEGYASINLPFPIFWYGKSYDTAYAFTNGFVSFELPQFDGQALGPPSVVPGFQDRASAFLAPVWANLIGRSGGNPRISTLAAGAAPNRVFAIEYRDFESFNLRGNSDVNFQVQLYETDGSVRVVYGPMRGVVGATAGLENDAGTMGGDLLQTGPGCGANCACAPRNCTAGVHLRDGRVVTIAPPSTADLIGWVQGPTGAYPGEAFTVSYRVSNVGNTAAAASSAQLRLSTDTTIDAGDVLLATRAIPALAVRTAHEATVPVTMPQLPVGRYYLGLIVDSASVVTEASEGNNTAIDPKGIVTGPDLTASSVRTPAVSGPGEILTVNVDLVSIGAPVTEPVSYDLYLSTDATLSAGDVLLGSFSATLPDGFSRAEQVQVTIPLGQPPSPPSYRVLAVLDPEDAVEELNEANNVVASAAPLTLIPPNVRVAQDSIRAGTVAFQDAPYPVELEVANLGGALASNFLVCVYLSTTPSLGAGANPRELYRSPALTLRSGQSERLRVEPVIPNDLTPGSYYLGVRADCTGVLTESDEADNDGFRAGGDGTPLTTLVRAPAPNLKPVALMLPPSGTAGASIPVAVQVANDGVVDAEVKLRFVLTAGLGIEPGDPVLLTTAAAVSVPAGQEPLISYELELSPEVPSGGYWITVLVDPEDEVEEVFEDDNLLSEGPFPVAGSNLYIVSPPPPPAATGSNYIFEFFAIGGSGDYTWQLDWTQGAPAGLSFSPSTRRISGTPDANAIGQYPFRVEVQSGGASFSATQSLRVTPPLLPLTVISGRLPAALRGERYSVPLVVVGGQAPHVWRVRELDRLPSGLALSVDGVLSGRPSRVGASVFEVEVRDEIGSIAFGTYSLDVIDPAAGLSISTPDIPSGNVGVPYEVQFQVSGGTPNYRWSFDAPNIPGLTLLPAGALMTGTPTVAGVYPIIVEVRDGRGLFDRNAYVLEVFEPGELSIATGRTQETRLPAGRVGAPYLRADGSTVRFEATRRDGAVATNVAWMLVGGDLPAGLSLDTKTGALSGSPTTAGAYGFRLLVTDPAGDFDRRTFTIDVQAPVELPPPEDDGCSCQAAAAPSPLGGLSLLALAAGALWRRRRPLSA